MFNGTLFSVGYFSSKKYCESLKQNELPSQQNTIHSINNILNLPIELKQNIALRLDSKDYASLRESCLAISQDIDSFHVLNQKMMRGFYRNENKGKINSILMEQLVRMVMQADKDGSIAQALKNVSLSRSKLSVDHLFITVMFSTQQQQENRAGFVVGDCCPDWIKSVFVLFKNETCSIVKKSKLIIFQRRDGAVIKWMVSVKFKDEFICYSQLKAVFIRLTDAFNQVHGAEKLLVAIMADELKSYFYKNTPHGLIKEDINDSARGAESLFLVADIIKRVTQESSCHSRQ